MAEAVPEFSVVVPMKNEEDSVAFLIQAIETACAGRAFEVIFVNDGSEDGTGAALDHWAEVHDWVRPVHHAQSAGQSAAVHSGVLAARAEVICTMDGDGQNPPAELPRLVAPILEDSRAGLIAGQRVKRADNWSKRMGSKFANALRSWLLGDGTRDTGCGLKAFRRDVFLSLPYFNHMHRFLPALFRAHGHDVQLLDVTHAARYAGRSNYTNLQRALVGLADLFGVMWLIRRRKRVGPNQIRWPNGRSPRLAQHQQHPRPGLDGGGADGPADVLRPVSDPVD